MKKHICILLLIICFLLTLSACSKPETEGLNIMTYNIQNRNADVEWKTRQELMAAYVTKYQPDVAGLQEVTMSDHEWIKYLPDAFGKKYAYVGESRSQNPSEGLEACLIFYRKDKFKLLKSGTFWLNKDEEKGALGWDAAYPRVCTYALLKLKSSGKKILVMNTHLDHIGSEARIKGFDQIMAKAKEISSFEYPVFILGDLNAYEGHSNGNYDHYMSYDEIEDTRHLAKETQEGNTLISSKHNMPIDFIFASNTDEMDLLRYKIMDEYDIHKDYPFIDMSDHFGCLFSGGVPPIV